jgi:5-methylcytosine-specific restriction endonuclease McrA
MHLNLNAPELRRCTLCLQYKAPTLFDCRSSSRDGLFARCKECRHRVYSQARSELRRERERFGTKQCRRCLLVMPFTEFDFTGFRHRFVCRECLRPPEKKPDDKPTTKACKDCREIRSIDAKWYGHLCPGCLAAKHREYYRANAESVIVRTKVYAKENPHIARKAQRNYRSSLKGKHRDLRCNLIRRARVECQSPSAESPDLDILFKQQNGRCANLSCSKRLRKTGGPQKRFHVDHIVPLALNGTNEIGNLQLLCPNCNLSKGSKSPEEWRRANGVLF